MKQILLTDEDLQALAGMIDAGLRAAGLRGARDAVRLIEVLEGATEVVEPKPKRAKPTP